MAWRKKARKTPNGDVRHVDAAHRQPAGKKELAKHGMDILQTGFKRVPIPRLWTRDGKGPEK
jgi:hypothetical protein